MMMQPLPNMNRAFSMLIQKERQMNQEYGEPRVLANVTDNSGRGKGGPWRGNHGRGMNNGGRNTGNEVEIQVCPL